MWKGLGVFGQFANTFQPYLATLAFNGITWLQVTFWLAQRVK